MRRGALRDPPAVRGLLQLLRPVLGTADRLGTLQGTALLGGLGLREVTTTEPLVLATAVVDLIVAVAADRPVLVSIRCYWTATDPAASQRVAAVTADIDERVDDVRLLAVLGLAATVRLGSDVRARMHALAGRPLSARDSCLLAAAATAVGDPQLAAHMLVDVVSGLRDEGRAGRLTEALVQQAWAEVLIGESGKALPSARDAAGAAELVGRPRWRAAADAAHAVCLARAGRPAGRGRDGRPGRAILLVHRRLTEARAGHAGPRRGVPGRRAPGASSIRTSPVWTCRPPPPSGPTIRPWPTGRSPGPACCWPGARGCGASGRTAAARDARTAAEEIFTELRATAFLARPPATPPGRAVWMS